MAFDFKSLPEPEIIEQFSFDEILSKNVAMIKNQLPDWNPIEGDDFMVMCRAFSYKELFLRKRIDNSIKSMMLAYSGGSNLDHLAAMYGIKRSDGAFPSAKYELTLKQSYSYDVLIPKGLRISDEKGENIAELADDVFFKKGETVKFGFFQLLEYVKISFVRPTKIISDDTFLSKVEIDDTMFKGGDEKEDDDRLKEKIMLSLSRFSTAGSEAGYRYHALAADSRVLDVKIISKKAGTVQVYFLENHERVEKDFRDSGEKIKEIQRNILNHLNDKNIRPLNDKVEVLHALEPQNIQNVELKLKVFVQSEDVKRKLEDEIFDYFNGLRFKFDEELTIKRIYERFKKWPDVYDVVVEYPTETIRSIGTKILKISVKKLDVINLKGVGDV